MSTINPLQPVADLLSVSGLSQSELARRMGLVPHAVANQLNREKRGGSVSLDWFLRAAEAAGLKIDIRATKKRTKGLAAITDG